MQVPLKTSPTPAVGKPIRLHLLFAALCAAQLCRPPLPAAVAKPMRAEGCVGSCGMQMPSCGVCLFGSGREVCRWSLGWRRAYGLGVGCCSAALLLHSPLRCSHSDRFVSFHNKSDNKDVAKSFMEPKGRAVA